MFVVYGLLSFVFVFVFVFAFVSISVFVILDCQATQHGQDGEEEQVPEDGPIDRHPEQGAHCSPHVC